MRRLARLALGFLAGTASAMMPTAAQEPPTSYGGPCDISAAVALDADHFVAANDEHDTLYVYRRGQPRAVGSLDLAQFLGTRPGEESDIEGAAIIGTRVYWITSHGRNSKGKEQKSRQRLFATDMLPGNPPSLKTVGQPYSRLLRDLEDEPALKPYKLGDAARLAAEAEGGLNIEGLAATPDGQLLIGLRNPLPHRRALIVPLANPAQVVDGAQARLGAPIELDLGGRGIRSIERVGAAYLIVAGPAADSGSFALYRWSGQPGDTATPFAGIALGSLRPEALFAIPHSDRVQLLSDDGGVKVGSVECKKLPAAQQAFRSLVVKP